MTITVNHHHYFHNEGDSEIIKQLSLILKNQTKIMGQLEVLEEKVTKLEGQVDTLQTTIDNDQASDAQVVSDLTALNEEQKSIIADLRAQLEGAVDPTALAALADRLDAVSGKVDTAIADVAGPNA